VKGPSKNEIRNREKLVIAFQMLYVVNETKNTTYGSDVKGSTAKCEEANPAVLEETKRTSNNVTGFGETHMFHVYLEDDAKSLQRVLGFFCYGDIRFVYQTYGNSADLFIDQAKGKPEASSS